MVHVRFDPSSISHYSHQVGYGLGELSYFKGLPTYQRGSGLGDIFKGIWRFILPAPNVRLIVLQLIRPRKEILFGAFTPNLTKKTKSVS